MVEATAVRQGRSGRAPEAGDAGIVGAGASSGAAPFDLLALAGLSPETVAPSEASGKALVSNAPDTVNDETDAHAEAALAALFAAGLVAEKGVAALPPPAPDGSPVSSPDIPADALLAETELVPSVEEPTIPAQDLPDAVFGPVAPAPVSPPSVAPALATPVVEAGAEDVDPVFAATPPVAPTVRTAPHVSPPVDAVDVEADPDPASVVPAASPGPIVAAVAETDAPVSEKRDAPRMTDAVAVPVSSMPVSPGPAVAAVDPAAVDPASIPAVVSNAATQLAPVSGDAQDAAPDIAPDTASAPIVAATTGSDGHGPAAKGPSEATPTEAALPRPESPDDAPAESGRAVPVRADAPRAPDAAVAALVERAATQRVKTGPDARPVATGSVDSEASDVLSSSTPGALAADPLRAPAPVEPFPDGVSRDERAEDDAAFARAAERLPQDAVPEEVASVAALLADETQPAPSQPSVAPMRAEPRPDTPPPAPILVERGADVAARAAAAPAAPQTDKATDAAMADLRSRAVERQVLAALRQGRDEVRVALYPPQLGQVVIRLALDGQKVRVSMRAANGNAEDVLQAGEARLRDALGLEGFELSGFDVAGRTEDEGRRAPRRPYGDAVVARNADAVGGFSIDMIA